MGEGSKIAWCHHTFNPWMGCVAVSEACKFCYAEAFVTKRMGLPLWGPKAERRVTSAGNWREPHRWNKRAREAGQRHRVFCASLADVFEDRPDLTEPRARLFRLIEACPDLDWLLLTKRPEAMVRLAAAAGWTGAWPAHVWAGTTVENQARARERIPHLLAVPARVRFLSCEPLLERLDLADWIHPASFCSLPEEPCLAHRADADGIARGVGIDWVIVGGESGPGARAFDLDWARLLRDQCQISRTAYFFKQMGSAAHEDGVRVHHIDRKGADLDEVPEDLRVQEFPA